MSDRNTERQLIAGFHELEADSYRWTKHRFAVVLAVPLGAKANGAILQVNLYVPDSQVEKLGPITLKADLNDRELPSETFVKGGAYFYRQTIPPQLLRDSACSIVFTFDKSMRERGSEGRELAATVNEISLTQLDPVKETKHS